MYVYVYMYVCIETSSGLQERFILNWFQLIYNAPLRVEHSLKSIHRKEIDSLYV